MAGRGGYYGALHSAYPAFPDHSSQNVSVTPDGAAPFSLLSHRGVQSTATASSTSTSNKLDEILALLHNQEEKISSLTTEVYPLVATYVANY